jgi:hypothetical protein
VSDNVHHSTRRHPTDVEAPIESFTRELTILKYGVKLNTRKIRMAMQHLEELERNANKSTTERSVQMPYYFVFLAIMGLIGVILAMRINGYIIR